MPRPHAYPARGPQPYLPSPIDRLKQPGLTLSLDTNDDPADQWHGTLGELLDFVDTFQPYDEEACRINGAASKGHPLELLGKRHQVGQEGSLVCAQQKVWSVPAMLLVPVETIGVGDSFSAGIVSAWLRSSPSECAQRGNRAVGRSTHLPGGTEDFCGAAQLQTLSGPSPLIARTLPRFASTVSFAEISRSAVHSAADRIFVEGNSGLLWGNVRQAGRYIHPYPVVTVVTQLKGM